MKKYFLLILACITINLSQAQSYLGWTTSQLNLREGPGIDHKTIATLKPGSQIFISSLESKNGFINIIDIATNNEGFVSKSYIKVGDEVPVSSQGILQNTGKVGSYQPEIEIYNNTVKDLTLKMNDRIYNFSSRERKTFNLPPGNYEYRASAPGVIPDLGTERIESNNGYKWEFYILTR